MLVVTTSGPRPLVKLLLTVTSSKAIGPFGPPSFALVTSKAYGPTGPWGLTISNKGLRPLVTVGPWGPLVF